MKRFMAWGHIVHSPSRSCIRIIPSGNTSSTWMHTATTVLDATRDTTSRTIPQKRFKKPRVPSKRPSKDSQSNSLIQSGRVSDSTRPSTKAPSYPSNRPDRANLPEETYVHGMLAKAKTPMDVLEIYETEKSAFDVVNYCHGLHKITKLHLEKAPWKRNPLPLSQIQQYVEDLQETLEHTSSALAPRTLSGIAWGLGKLNVDAPSLLDRVVANAMGQVSRFNHGDVSQLLYGMSRLGYRQKTLLDELASHVKHGLRFYSVTEMTNILVSYASLKHIDEDLFGLIKDKLRKHKEELSPQHVSNAVYSFAKAGLTDKSFYEPFSRYIIENSNIFTSQGLANVLWAYHKAGLYQLDLFSALAKNMGHPQRAKHASPQSISNACHAVAHAYWNVRLVNSHLSQDELLAIKRDLRVDRLFNESAKAMIRHLDPDASGVSEEKLEKNANQQKKRQGQYLTIRSLPVSGHDIAEMAVALSLSDVKSAELTAKLCASVRTKLRSMTTPDIATFYSALPSIATPFQGVTALLVLHFYRSVLQRLLKNLPADKLTTVLQTTLLVQPPPREGDSLCYSAVENPIHASWCEQQRYKTSPRCNEWHSSPALSQKVEEIMKVQSVIEEDASAIAHRNQVKLLRDMILPGLSTLKRRHTELGASRVIDLLYDVSLSSVGGLGKDFDDWIEVLLEKAMSRKQSLSHEDLCKAAYSLVRLTQLQHASISSQSSSGLTFENKCQTIEFFESITEKLIPVLHRGELVEAHIAQFAWAFAMVSSGRLFHLENKSDAVNHFVESMGKALSRCRHHRTTRTSVDTKHFSAVLEDALKEFRLCTSKI